MTDSLSGQMTYLFLNYCLPCDVLSIDWEVLWLRLSGGACFFLICVCCLFVCSMRLMASTQSVAYYQSRRPNCISHFKTPFHYLPSEIIVKQELGTPIEAFPDGYNPDPHVWNGRTPLVLFSPEAKYITRPALIISARHSLVHRTMNTHTHSQICIPAGRYASM